MSPAGWSLLRCSCSRQRPPCPHLVAALPLAGSMRCAWGVPTVHSKPSAQPAMPSISGAIISVRSAARRLCLASVAPPSGRSLSRPPSTAPEAISSPWQVAACCASRAASPVSPFDDPQFQTETLCHYTRRRRLGAVTAPRPFVRQQVRDTRGYDRRSGNPDTVHVADLPDRGGSARLGRIGLRGRRRHRDVEPQVPRSSSDLRHDLLLGPGGCVRIGDRPVRGSL